MGTDEAWTSSSEGTRHHDIRSLQGFPAPNPGPAPSKPNERHFPHSERLRLHTANPLPSRVRRTRPLVLRSRSCAAAAVAAGTSTVRRLTFRSVESLNVTRSILLEDRGFPSHCQFLPHSTITKMP